MNIAVWLQRAACDQASRPALCAGTQTLADYAGFHARAAALAGALSAQGIGPGDRVAIWMTNHTDYLVALWAIWIEGAVAVPINARLHPNEAAWIATNAGAKFAFTSADLGAALEGATGLAHLDAGSAALGDACSGKPLDLVPRRAEDLAWLFYTSGTTGRPKGVCITHGMLVAMSLMYLSDVDEVAPLHAALYAAPMSHGAGLYAPVHVLRGAAHIAPASGGFDEAEILDLAEAQGAVSMFLAPTMVRRLTRHARETGRDGRGIRTIVYGGGPMYVADLAEALDTFGPKFVQIYGQGECPMAIAALGRDDIAGRDHPDWAARAGSVGRAQSGVQIAIAGEKGQTLPIGEAGEILVRGLPVMPGYWQNDEASATTLADGWLHTGDIGRLDGGGYLTLVDRSKDLIISGGSNIYPREVEEVLLTCPGVAEASVVGRPHPEWGEEVVAFIVLDPGTALDTAALEAHCNDRMARYKRPRAWIALDALPKNNYGKILKTALRARLAGS